MTTASSHPDSRAPISAPDIRARKGDGPRLVMVTAYDYPSARVADAAGVDMILVGDTLAMVVLGHEDTLQVTTDDMAHHVAAAGRAKPKTPMFQWKLPESHPRIIGEKAVSPGASAVSPALRSKGPNEFRDIRGDLPKPKV